MLKLLGIITKARGVDGSFSVESYLADEISIESESPCSIGYSETFSREYSISSLKSSGKGFIVKLKNIDSKEEITPLKEMGIYIDPKYINKKADKNSFNASEIIGCTVVNNPNRKKLGVITDIMNLPANDIWVLSTENGEEIYIPAIKDVIKKISLKEKKIYITPIEGLLDLNKKN